MSKTCVQPVQSNQEKSGGIRTHFVHNYSLNVTIYGFFQTTTYFFLKSVRVYYTALSTRNLFNLTVFTESLSPLSTLPITTTTTYISNKGATI